MTLIRSQPCSTQENLDTNNTPGFVHDAQIMKGCSAELKSLGDYVEKSAVSHPELSPEVMARFRDLCPIVAQKERINHVQDDEDAKILKFIFPMIFSPNASIRQGARNLVNAFSKLPKDFNIHDFLPEFEAQGKFFKWMLNEIDEEQNVEALLSWQTVIRALGKFIHSSNGTGVLNSLLSIAEKGFKSQEVEIRKETFYSWETLINNFAMSELILNQPKRVKLITRPLITQSNLNREVLAKSKFETFWFYITKLGVNLHLKHHATVVVPFLDLFYGPPGTPEEPNPNTKPNMSTVAPPLSPVKRFECLQSRSLEALAQLFHCPVVSRNVRPLELSGAKIEVKNFVKNHPTFMHSLKEAFNCLTLHSSGRNSQEDVANFQLLFQAFVGIIHSIENSSDKTEIATISSFFIVTLYLISESFSHPHTQSLALVILDEVKRFPSNLLNSRGIWKPKLDPPGLTFTKTVLGSGLRHATVMATPEQKTELMAITQTLLKKGCANKNETLKFLQASIQALDQNVNAKEEKTWELITLAWISIASTMKDHLDKHMEINQADSPIVHCIDGALDVMSFPLKNGNIGKGFVKPWTDLYGPMTNAAALIMSYNPPEIEAKLSESILKQLEQASFQEFKTLLRLFGQHIIQGMAFKAMNDAEHDLDELRVHTIANCLAAFVEVFSKFQLQVEPSDGIHVLKAIALMANGLTSLRFQAIFVKTVLPKTIMLFSEDMIKKFGKAYEDQLERTTESMILCIESRCQEQCNAALLSTLNGFLVTLISHNKRFVRDRAQKMWQSTFAKTLKPDEIPVEICSILKKTLASTSSTSEDSQPLNVALYPAAIHTSVVSTPSTITPSSPSTNVNKPTTTNSPLAFGSFLKRNGATPTKAELKEGSSPWKFKKPSSDSKVAKVQKSLEDESSQDFVKITPSKKSKKRVLTDHQKDVLTSRKDDIPALYSELSREDSSQIGLPVEFASQSSLSQEEAIDESVFQEQVSKSQSSEKESEESAAHRKRKNKTPVKNLPFITKRLQGSPSSKPGPKSKKANNLQVPVEDNEHNSSSESKSSESSGRPRRRRSKSRLSLINGEVCQSSEVKLSKLSPAIDEMVQSSPVKVVQEKPLLLEPIVDKSSSSVKEPSKKVVKELKFDSIENEPEEQDVIESSQVMDSQEEVNKSRVTRKRRRSALLNGTEDSPQKNLRLRNSSSSESPSPSTLSANRINKYGETPLHGAVKKADLERVRTLLEKGADVHKADHAGWTPIHEAVRDRPNALETIQLLLDHGANINVQALDGNTPLHDAASYLSLEMIQFLVKHGADPNIKNKDGNTPLDLAPLIHKKALKAAYKEAQKDAKKDGKSPSKSKVPKEQSPKKSSQSVPPTNVDPKVKETKSKPNERSTEASSSSSRPREEDKENANEKEASETTTGSAEPEVVEKTKIPETLEVMESPSSQQPVLNERPNSNALKAPPVPNFTKIVDDRRRGGSLPFPSGRGAKLVEMSKAKKGESSSSSGSSTTTSMPPLMSPKVTLDSGKGLSGEDLLVTPTHRRKEPWEKYVPSPSDASPSASILKKRKKRLLEDQEQQDQDIQEGETMDDGPPSLKRRRVQFTNPPVSERVEIPRLTYLGKSVRQRLSTTKFDKDTPLLRSTSDPGAQHSDSDEESQQSAEYQATPPIDMSSTEMIYPTLRDNEDPVTSILSYLASPIWQKAAEKSMSENGITRICDLARLIPSQTTKIRGLAPPDNITTIKAALKKHEVSILKKYRPACPDPKRLGLTSVVKKNAPVVDISTPEENEQRMREMFERPSPSPTEEVEAQLPRISEINQIVPKVVDLDEEPEPEIPELPTILNSYQKPTGSQSKKPKIIMIDIESGTDIVDPADKEQPCQPKSAGAVDAEVNTECTVTKEMEIQTEDRIMQTSESQTEALSVQAAFQEALDNLSRFDTAMLSQIIEQSASALKSKLPTL